MRYRSLVVMAVCLSFILAGCSPLGPDAGLPSMEPNAPSYELIYDEDTGETSVQAFGRTYSFFGCVNGSMREDSARECIGYAGSNEDLRFYTLSEDPYDNYLMLRKTNCSSEDIIFLRDKSTLHQDIFTPSYIKSAGYESWGSSGVYYEMQEALVGFTVNADNIKYIHYDIKVNGRDAMSGYTGDIRGDSLPSGDVNPIGIDEAGIRDKADPDKPFDIEITLHITDMDDNYLDVSGTYSHEIMLGGYINGPEIRYSEEDGYYLYEA